MTKQAGGTRTTKTHQSKSKTNPKSRVHDKQDLKKEIASDKESSYAVMVEPRINAMP